MSSRRHHASRSDPILLKYRILLLGLATAFILPESFPTPSAGLTAVAAEAGFEVRFARVIDGDSLEVVRDGRQVPVGLIGISAAAGNTACGKQAAAALRLLVRGGVRLEDDPAVLPDRVGRRMHYATTRDGLSIQRALVLGGFATATGEGKQRDQLTADEATARQQGVGCVGERRQLLSSISAATPKSTGQSGPSAAAQPVDSGFVSEVIASGFNLPTSFAQIPDGRLLVAEKNGLIWLVVNGVTQSTPVLDLRSRVNDYWDRGFIGLAVDPAFSSTPYVYVGHTFENDVNDYQGPKTSRVSRFTMSGQTASLGSEVILAGSVNGPGCPSNTTRDCLHSNGVTHSIGGIRFGTDGSLFVTSGEGAIHYGVDPNALRAQDRDSLGGKLLRMTRDGAGLSSNPFYTGDSAANRSRVWAYGLRNPYRFGIRAGSGAGVPYVGDVGGGAYEEVDVALAGRNFGWPCYEGPVAHPDYAVLTECSASSLPPSSVTPPLVSDNHNGESAAVTGGFFYSGSAFPAQYSGVYFFGDYANGLIRHLTVNSDHSLASGPTLFATNASGPVDIQQASDGSLLYLAIQAGELRRIRYSGAGTVTCPDGQFRADYFANPDLAGAPVMSRCEATIHQDWFGASPGAGLPIDQFSVRWTGTIPFGAGTYTFFMNTDDGVRLLIDGTLKLDRWNTLGQFSVNHTFPTVATHEIRMEYVEHYGDAVAEMEWYLAAQNAPPVPTIQLPSTSSRFAANETVTYGGSASDPEDGVVPPDQLNWELTIHHCPGGDCHSHPFLQRAGVDSGSFQFPDHGDDSYLEMVLIATDAAGLQGSASMFVQPKVTTITIDTLPTGLQVTYGGQTYTAPLNVTTQIGATRTIGVSSPQGAYTFTIWSDGGLAQHDITVPTAAATYTATFASSQPPPTITSVSPAEGATGMAVGSATSATFSIAMDPATISNSTVSLTRQGATSSVAASVTYDAVSRTARLQPSASLASGTSYTARVKGGTSGVRSLQGVPLASDRVWSFTTAGSPDTTAPTILDLTATSITTSSAIVTWRTNEPATTRVQYGTTKSMTLASPLDVALTTQHSVTLTGLSPGKRYYYRSLSTDAAGNSSASTRRNFSTLAGSSTTGIE